MATYSLTINEKTETGRSLINLLHSMNDVVTIAPLKGDSTNSKISKEEFLSDLKQSVSDAKNKKTKPLSSLING